MGNSSCFPYRMVMDMLAYSVPRTPSYKGDVESVVGKGTRFILNLPWRRPGQTS